MAKRRLSQRERRIYSEIDSPVWVFDVAQKDMVWANDAALVLWDSESTEQLTARDFSSDMSAATEIRLQSYQVRFERGESVTEQWTFYPNGEAKTVLCTFSGITLEDGRPAMLSRVIPASTVDVASLRGVEALRHTSVIISMCGRDGQILMENPAALRAYGFTDEIPEGVHAFAHRFVDADEGKRALVRVLEEGSFSDEVQVRTRKGETWHGLDAHLTHDPVDGGAAIVINEKDIGWRVEAQNKLQEAWQDLEETVSVRTQELTKANAALALSERMASLGTLAAGVAHEVNNPLTFVIHNLTLIGDAFDRGRNLRLGELKQMLADAQMGVDRVARIVRDLGAITRNKAGSDGPVDVHSLIDFTLAVTEHEVRPRARLERRLGEISLVRGDSSKLNQVLLNLVINAAHSIEPGEADKNRITVTTSTDAGGNVIIVVSDTGAGIAAENLPRVFEPFFTTKDAQSGTGLGLSICYRIVQEMGGTISVESQVGQGTRFRLSLPPYKSSRQQEGSATPDVSAPSTKSIRILVVDDEPMILRVLERMLPHYDVVTTESGRKTPQIIRDQGPFDVIFCDLTMPDGSGIDVYNSLGEISPDLQKRFIIMSGGAVTPEAENFLHSVPNQRLGKPFTLAEIEKHIALCMRAQNED